MNEETDQIAVKIAECLSEVTGEIKKSILKNLSETHQSFSIAKTNNANMLPLSEVEGAVRKICLDISPSAKKSITETPDKPSAGDVSNGKIDVETKFNEIIKKKGGF